MNRAQCAEQGVILIALLWILVALSTIALSFSRECFVEVAVARNNRDLTGSYYIARAGIQATVYRLMEKRFTPPVQGIEQPAFDEIDLGRLEGEFGGGRYRVEIQDESGKINLNFVGEEQLRSLLEAVGIQKPYSDVLVDSVMDWRDIDSAFRLNGAENEYYQSLPRPYKAKNGRIDTVEELLMIKGVTPEYFFGRWVKGMDGTPKFLYGISRYLTVYSTTNRVNINYAPLEVLLSLPGISPEAAAMIFERRKTKPFRNLGELTQEVPITLGPTTLPFLSTDQTGMYTLTSYGQMQNTKVRRVVRAVISLDPSQATGYKTLYWNENVPDL